MCAQARVADRLQPGEIFHEQIVDPERTFSPGTVDEGVGCASGERVDTDCPNPVKQHVGALKLGPFCHRVAAGSSVYTSNNISIYIPTTNFTVVPCRVGDQGFPNLVKQSSSTANFWTGAGYNSSMISPVRAAANNSTQTPAVNGRYIKINQWNKPGLLGDPGSGTIPTVPSSYATPPDWILVTRQGTITNAATLPAVGSGTGTLSDKRAGNGNYVIGRYAYTIYDEAGLLDVNVAGFPSSLSGTDFTTKRGVLPQVDLSNLLNNAAINDPNAIADANALVQWRNSATIASTGGYTNYVFTATNGFTTVAPGDQAFVSRKDLINFIKNEVNGSQIPTAALPYLGTFTRELNAPSYAPSATRPHTISGQGYRYSSQDPGDLDNQFNPSLINIRVSGTFTRNDGSQAMVGEPLIKSRFPLSRLALFGNSNGAIVDTTSDIYKYFGLTRSSASQPWIYNHGDSQRILTLSEIASGSDPGAPNGREPDFFELLQAAIIIGSLGKTGVSSFTNPDGALNNYDSNTYYQIIQIGANLMDQYDTDSFPTRISLSGVEFDGVENLPYLVRVFVTPYRFNGPSYGPYDEKVGLWYQPEVWNPHAEATTVPTNGPTQFRYVVAGSMDGYFTHDLSFSASSRIAYTAYRTFAFNNSSFNDAGDDWIQFSTASNNFSVPTLLTPANAIGSGNGIVSDKGNNFLGIWIGNATAPDTALGDPAATTTYLWAGEVEINSTTHELQYWDGQQWITYSQIKYLAHQYESNNFDNDGRQFRLYGSPSLVAPGIYDIHSDPRTDRFGTSAGGVNPDPGVHNTLRPNASLGYQTPYGVESAAGWTTGNDYFGYLSDNLPSSATRYADPDGVTRPAAGAYTTGTLPDGYPLATGNFNSRPCVLNRPFRSVADMGYAFRDQPWKDIDFFSSQSADASLLDVFCLNESPAPASGTTILPPVAGMVDLNSRQPPVLQAILTGALKAEDSTTTISSSDAQTLASNLVNLTTALPLLNRSELVTRWISNTSIGSLTDSIVKRHREAAVRSLADVGDARTWNLLIDVIAQSGYYPSTSTGINQFFVQGERRYWLHVAIDRYTGKVVAQSLEPVYE